jgi:DNA invertase Pin-like site-specific DNA recombinase
MPRFQRRDSKRQQSLTGWGQIELNTDAGLGIYARQSTLAQVKNYRQSLEMQTDDLIAYAKRLGWDEERIILFTQDLAKSGTLRIDQREGLRSLIERIEAGEIKTVLVFLEDRLFRDETGIQYNVFIDVCKRHGVFVVTPHMTYDFTNPFHTKQFRWRCEEAADYLRDYVLHRLHGARNRVLESGRFAGRSIPIGYVVDNQEYIVVEGTPVPNPTYRKYIPYEPHAKIVRWLFTRYMEIGGRIRPLCRELYQLPLVFPDFGPDVDVSKHLALYRHKKVPGGYHLTRPGLIGLLTNVTYIGYWVHQGEVIHKSNHEAIVDEELFWYAFNRLSVYTITGERNEQRHGYTRYSRKDPLPALLKNVIGTRKGGRVYVSTSGLTRKPCYVIEDRDEGLILTYQAAPLCQGIDTIFSSRLAERMKQTKRYEHYREYAEQLVRERDQLTKTIDEQLAEIDKQTDALVASLLDPKLKDEQDPKIKRFRDKLIEKGVMLEGQKEELEKKRESLHSDETSKKLMEYYALAEQLAEHWDTIAFEDKQALVEVLVKGVYLDHMTNHWLRLEVEWLDPQWGTERIYLYRSNGRHKSWTPEEDAIIKQFYEEAPREEVMAKLPTRSWQAITQQANSFGLKRNLSLVSPSELPLGLSMEDIAFMQQVGIQAAATYCHKWESVHRLQSSA